MQVDEIQNAYDLGLADVRGTGPLGGLGRGLHYLMPYVVAFARNGRSPYQGDDWPDYAALSPNELKAMEVLHAALNDDQFDVMERYPAAWAVIVPLAHEALDSKGKTLERCKLYEIAPEPELGITNPSLAAAAIVGFFNRFDFDKIPTVDQRVDFEECGTIAGLEQSRDPDLWHLVPGGFNFDSERTFEVLNWIIEQPECDRATAALIFLRLCGSDYVGKPIIPEDERSRPTAEIINKICKRSESEGFARSELSLSCVEEADDQRPLLQEMVASYSGAIGDCIPIPTRLFSVPFIGRAPITPYVVQDEGYIQFGF